jgi:uncharacterized protein (TIGR04255 family)
MNYTKPPIIEAVIEFQFTGDYDEGARAKIVRKLKKRYPVAESIQEITLEAGPTGANQSVRTIGLKLSSQDRSECVTLISSVPPTPIAGAEPRPAAFAVSQLAPYCGWNSFCQRFSEDWAIVEKVIGKRKLLRIGVRFINRIDIYGEIDDPQHWVLAGPTLPAQFARPKVFNMHAVVPIDSAQVNLLVGTVPSPLPHCSSIVLDIDIYTTDVISDQTAERLEILNNFRSKKNWIFESCITDAARELFK